MSKIKLDLKGYRHVSSTNDSTTLAHPVGHVITLQHAPLSPENRAQLKALAGAAKSAQTPMQAEEAKSQMAKGGKVKGPNNPKLAESKKSMIAPSMSGHLMPDAGMTSQAAPFCSGGKAMAEGGYTNATPQQRIKATDPTPETPEEPSTWNKIESSINDAGQSFKQAVGAEAEGGEVKNSENKIDYSQFTGDKRPMPKGNTTALNYKDLKQQYKDKNRIKYAEGTNDAGNDIPTNLDPNSANPQPTPQDNTPTQQPSMEQRIGEAIGHGVRAAFNSIPAVAAYHTVKENMPAITKGVQGVGKGLGLRDTTDEDVANQSQNQSDQNNSTDNTRQPQEQQEQPPQSPTQNQVPAFQQPTPAAPPAVAPAQLPMPATYAGIKQGTMNDMATEHKNFEQDLVDGHIQPKTYNSLFADMKTPERIGTLFGMLLSGAGSGLSHQPNAVFAMMNQQISNDLQAQQESKTNAMNYLKTNQQALMAQAQSKNLNQATAIQAYNLSKMQMNSAALHQLALQAQNIKDPQQQAVAQQQLAALSQSVQQDNYNLQDRAAAATAYYKMMGVGSQNAAQDPEAAFKQQTNFLRMQGGVGAAKAADMEAKHVPGYTDQASREIPDDLRAKITAHDVLANKAQDLQNYIQQNRMTMSPSKRAVAQQKAAELTAYYSQSVDSGVMTQGRMAWLDNQISTNPTGVAASLLGNEARIKEIANSNNARKNTLLQNVGINPLHRQSGGGSQQQQGPQVQEGTTGKENSSGRPIIFTNGKWQYR